MTRNIKAFSLSNIVAALFILLFVYTGIMKLYERHEFQIVLSKSPLLQHDAAMISTLLPIAELIVAVLLFFPLTKLVGLVASLMMMCIFTSYISYMLLFTPDLPCSCGGVLKEMTWKQHWVFNIVFTLLALIGIWDLLKTKRIIAIIRTSRTPV